MSTDNAKREQLRPEDVRVQPSGRGSLACGHTPLGSTKDAAADAAELREALAVVARARAMMKRAVELLQNGPMFRDHDEHRAVMQAMAAVLEPDATKRSPRWAEWLPADNKETK